MLIHLMMLWIIGLAAILGGWLFIRQMNAESKLFREYVKKVEGEEK